MDDDVSSPLVTEYTLYKMLIRWFYWLLFKVVWLMCQIWLAAEVLFLL